MSQIKRQATHLPPGQAFALQRRLTYDKGKLEGHLRHLTLSNKKYSEIAKEDLEPGEFEVKKSKIFDKLQAMQFEGFDFDQLLKSSCLCKALDLDCWQVQRLKLSVELLRNELKKQKSSTTESKIFMNLVIHDLRSPSSQIKYSMEFLLERMQALSRRNLTKRHQLAKDLGEVKDNVFKKMAKMEDTLVRQVMDKNSRVSALETELSHLQRKLEDLQQENEELKRRKASQEEKWLPVKAALKDSILTFKQGDKSPGSLHKTVGALERALAELEDARRPTPVQPRLPFSFELGIANEVGYNNNTRVPQDEAEAMDTISDDSPSLTSLNASFTRVVHSPVKFIKHITQSRELSLSKGGSTTATKVFNRKSGQLSLNDTREFKIPTKHHTALMEGSPHISQRVARQIKNIDLDDNCSMESPFPDFLLKDAFFTYKRELCKLNKRWSSLERSLKEQQGEDEKMFLSSVEMIESAKHSSSMLLNLINDLLDLAKQQNNVFELNQSYFDLTETITTAFKTLQFLSHKKQISTELVYVEGCEDFFRQIYGDENRYEQILINFLSNALKFTDPAGVVKVKLSVEKSEPVQHSRMKQRSKSFCDFGLEVGVNDRRTVNLVTFKIVVQDSGAGISQEGLRNLFVDFSSLKEHREQNKRGTGLGLSICKKIIQRMGGSVQVESELGKGTSFEIRISTKCRVEQQTDLGMKIKHRKQTPLRNFMPMRIGSPTKLKKKCSALNIQKMMRRSECPKLLLQNDLVVSGEKMEREESSESSQRSDSSNSFSKSSSSYNSSRSSLFEKCQPKMPLDDIPKPDLTALIVNDEEISLLALSSMFRERLKFKRSNVAVARNGEEAVAHTQKSAFDVIVMDLNMPVMDGFEACSQIKKNYTEQNLFGQGDETSVMRDSARRDAPFIVAVSAYELDSELVEKCQASGFDWWLSCPVQAERIQEEVVSKIMLRKNLLRE